jgi:broad specificity phosphatase PhoE
MNIGLFKRLFFALIEEFKMLLTMDSKFVDSPLNQEGIEQALELRKFIYSPQPGMNAFGAKVLAAMRGEGESSVVVTSCLRRAVSTTTLALWPRVERKGDKIIVLSSLQEISRNIDTVSISAPTTVADLPFSRLTPHCVFEDGKAFTVDSVFDARENYGTKKRNFYGIRRLKAFNEWVFERKEHVIVVGGHSLWFKYFFQTFMPLDVNHDAKNKKITNSGVVAFKLSRAEKGPDGLPIYRIAPESVTTIYGGFTSK